MRCFSNHRKYILLGNNHDGQHWNIIDSYTLTIKSLLRLRHRTTIETDRKKVMVVSTLLGGLILNKFWKCNLSSHFILQTKHFPFHTLEEFYTKTNIKVKCIIFQN